MVALSNKPNEASIVLLFGSQALDFNEESANQLRSTLLDSPSYQWILDVVEELPDHWARVSKELPDLQSLHGKEQLQNLKAWLEKDQFPQGVFPLTNLLLTPLVVITHLTQYLKFLDICNPGVVQHDNIPTSLKVSTETLGLCTGLLSSVAVSSSASQAQLEQHGAVAIRLAMVIGALVDARDTETSSQGKSKSFSVAWNSAESGSEMIKILNTAPEAYVSVVIEEKRVTVTTPSNSSTALKEKLKAAGMSVAEVGLRGRFHCHIHGDNVELLSQFCDSNPAFQFPDAAELVLPTRSNTGGEYITNGKLHHIVLRAMLVEQSNWQVAFAALQASSLAPDTLIATFGSERCVPPSLVRKLGPRLVQVADIGLASDLPLSKGSAKSEADLLTNDAIAVVGMSCELPGASDLESFWDILCEGKSQHVEAPTDRFDFETAWRDTDPKRTWYGNFIRNHDTFDHKFFKKSPREMASTDPQHRLMLQAAYQAVEQSGYFNSSTQDKHIGCYIGVGLVDYENNIACHPANAYSATGNLKAFAAGKISHYFGWTGPGLTIDTACSSSAVAVHQACRAILTGECSGALAGGVNIMTSPEWFQNLAGASFLSPTGQCKPFDANADGYCRAEGVGAVFLKKLSAAIADGNQVLGVIAASAVYQNENCTPITVPNASSLSNLFSTVTRRAGLEPKHISVVEAHGTGTPVGDPAEYDSVRKVFGGPIRTNTLSLGSVKGLLGHTESASGIVALIKTVLMTLEGSIPPQASHTTINPSINALPSDKIEITMKFKEWDVGFRAALINNYGASGSNASLVVTQAPHTKLGDAIGAATQPSTTKYPFWLCGFDEQSLRRYAARFAQFIKSKSSSANKPTLANLSFQLSRQSNRSLGQGLIFSCSSLNELEEKLTAFAKGNKNISVNLRPQTSRPVVLCFGGQISTFIGLDPEVYKGTKILRNHLDQCDNICQSLALGSIYPDIFQRTPVGDIVKLQTMLFAIQYSCAKSWMSSGVQVAAVVGHSFGEITALCVSGILSLQDTLKMVAGRARIIRDSWGSEKGSMMAIEADLGEVEKLLFESSNNAPGEAAATIACFNGPRSFTLAGSRAAIQVVKETASKNAAFSSMKSKVLDVTNAFHSTLVEPLIPALDQVGQDLVFNEPVIPLEMATKTETFKRPSSSFVASHMRNPVYFNHAVQRLAQRYPSCIWLEAGSNSTVTTMASRALGFPSGSTFQPVNVTSNGSFQFLTDATTNLWKEGLSISFPPHHEVHGFEYPPLLLPPYQFDKSKHWMELKKPQQAAVEVPSKPQVFEMPKRLWTFVGYQDSQKRFVRFRINTMTEKYQDYVSAHIIAQTAPICPSTFQFDIASDALLSLVSGSGTTNMQPELRGMDSHSPMVMDASKYVWLDAESSDDNNLSWDWKMVSSTIEGATSNTTLHVSGRIVFRPTDDSEFQKDFARYERLVGRQRSFNLLDGNEADVVIQGSRNIYKAFVDIVQYKHDIYRGLQKIAGKNSESAGRIIKAHSGDTWLDVGLADSFCQVAGIYLNSMTDLPETYMYISDRIDQWIRSPKASSGPRPGKWEVFACHQRPSEKECMSDVFVFDPQSGSLMEVILGIHYVRVSRASMGKLLSKLSPGSKSAPAAPSASVKMEATTQAQSSTEVLAQPPQSSPKKKKEAARPDIAGRARALLSDLSGLEPEDIKIGSDLVELGIDSLMGMELAREVELLFKCTLEMSELLDLTDFQSLVNCIEASLGFSSDIATPDEEEDEPEEMPIKQLQVNGVSGHTNGISLQPNESLSQTNGDGHRFPATVILDTFGESKRATDRFMEENKMGNYVHHVLPKTTELCIAHIVEGFEELGCSLRNAKPGQTLERVKYLPRHEQFMEFIYDLLEKARIVDLDGSKITRTAISVPAKSAQALLQDLVRDASDHVFDHRLTYLTGSRLAACLTGKEEGLQLIFASAEGREIVSSMYGKSPINVAWIKQMEHFLENFFLNLPKQSSPIKILEMGAGTGGTTAQLVKLLAGLNVPFQYTVTDLSPSLVAAARKRFKEYPFMQYRVLDIEKKPSAELLQSQDLIIATNCVHATHSLVTSTKNIHQILRPDGFLMMLEMTESLPWIDIIFGLLEGWWLFDDGRRHALVPASVWESTLQSVGYGHVDWTEGNLPETNIQRIIIALASGPRYERVPMPPKPIQSYTTDFVARQGLIDAFVHKHTREFTAPISFKSIEINNPLGKCVLVTGATGSLGSHLVAYLAGQASVKKIICVNRHSSTECTTRQKQALESRGIFLSDEALSKLKVLATDTAKSMLGLTRLEYIKLVNSVTHIIHNAWSMSLTRPISAFESQFKGMENLIGLAREISCRRHPQSPKVGFQFISSIATVGYYPLWSGKIRAPEERMTARSVLPTGYGDAKLVCEMMLDETLHKYPDVFRPMVVRIGQIAGSKSSGYWNPVEHLAFLIKSCQTLKVLPDFEGELSWCPVNDVAATLGELLLPETTPYPIYHIENPSRQPWKEMISTLAEALDVPPSNIIPFEEWVDRVRQFPGSVDLDNPAGRLVDFLEKNFVRMSCGDLVLDTAKSTEHSETLRNLGPVDGDLVRKYVHSWKTTGFLLA
ncbi:hypothetical protein O988_03530 [Pseudogymnoascus sp. VKM F-3808]|nr:hypothetical protein O988_03530 [Pseudogymnoascus sp. VKM F-3808]